MAIINVSALSPTFVQRQKAVVCLGVCVLIFLVILIVFFQMSIVKAVAGMLALSVADVVDLSTKQADASSSSATASHGGDKVQLFQQLLQLFLHCHMKPVVWIQHTVNWTPQEGVRLTVKLAAYDMKGQQI